MEYFFKYRELDANFTNPLDGKKTNLPKAYFYSFYKPLHICENLTSQKEVINLYDKIIATLNKIDQIDNIIDVWLKLVPLIEKVFPSSESRNINKKEASMLLQRPLGIIMNIDTKEGEANSTYFAKDTKGALNFYDQELAKRQIELKAIFELIATFFSDVIIELQSPTHLDNHPYLKSFRSSIFLEQLYVGQKGKDEILKIDYQDDIVMITSNPIKMGGYNTVSAIPCSEIQSHFCHLKSIRDDITQLCQLIGGLKTDYEIKLIAKYVVLEAFEFKKYANKLINKINQEKKNWKPVNKDISINLNDFFDHSKITFWKKIRDKIAAHRDNNWDTSELQECWDFITVDSINKLISIVECTFTEILASNHFLFSPFTAEGVALKGATGVKSPVKRKRFFDSE